MTIMVTRTTPPSSRRPHARRQQGLVNSREWHLVRRPTGRPDEADVALVTVEVPEPAPGQLLVRNDVMSVEPYMRGRMSDGPSYAEPYALNAPMTGHAVGEVVASGDADVPVGARVLHELGWRELAVVPTSAARVLPDLDVPPSSWLGVLGLTGFTAYAGLLTVAAAKPGDTVFVSAAAGAVGATAAQIAKAMGCTVIGSAGSEAKVRYLVDELGLDAAFSHREPSVRAALKDALGRAGTDGIDVYFDNVGGEQLECALRHMRLFGRLALCGAIATYDATEPVPGPRNLLLLIWRRLRMEGFLVGDHEAARPAFERVMAGWLAEGRVRSVETVQEGGIDQAWRAFTAMLDGENVGKMVVQLRG
jgi:NADPH-dependent curcumin reductase CurA